jgi:hypothetical protein
MPHIRPAFALDVVAYGGQIFAVSFSIPIRTTEAPSARSGPMVLARSAVSAIAGGVLLTLALECEGPSTAAT